MSIRMFIHMSIRMSIHMSILRSTHVYTHVHTHVYGTGVHIVVDLNSHNRGGIGVGVAVHRPAAAWLTYPDFPGGLYSYDLYSYGLLLHSSPTQISLVPT